MPCTKNKCSCDANKIPSGKRGGCRHYIVPIEKKKKRKRITIDKNSGKRID